MKFWCQLWIGTVITCLVASTVWAEQATNANADKTMAPYFFVEGQTSGPHGICYDTRS